MGRKKRQETELAITVRLAGRAGMSYGKYVASTAPRISARAKSKYGSKAKKSSWVHPKRTIIEALSQELTSIESRTEWLY